MDAKQAIAELKKHANKECVAGMARFGISPEGTLGVSLPVIRKIAKQMGKNHAVALELRESGIHEARMLAAMVAEPEKTTPALMEKWVSDFDSWDICDQACMNLFRETPYAYKKAHEWAKRNEEFVKRAGFSLMATLAVGDKKAADRDFEKFLPLIKKGATDERNFVKKAVNWALRQIGKRNIALNKKAITAAKEISKINSKSARWAAKDALRELQSAAVRKRLRENTGKRQR